MKPWEFFFANHAMKIDLLASAVLKNNVLHVLCVSTCKYEYNVILSYN